MRYLVKGDCGIPCADTDRERLEARHRARRLRIRRLLAFSCLLFAGAFAIPLFRGLSAESIAGGGTEWDSPASVFTWFRGTLGGLGWQFRHGIQEAVPYGNLGVILKMSLCAVAAAVFLRGPHRT